MNKVKTRAYGLLSILHQKPICNSVSEKFTQKSKEDFLPNSPLTSYTPAKGNFDSQIKELFFKIEDIGSVEIELHSCNPKTIFYIQEEHKLIVSKNLYAKTKKLLLEYISAFRYIN